MKQIVQTKSSFFSRTSNKPLPGSEKKLCLKANYVYKGGVRNDSLENTVKEVNCLLFLKSGLKITHCNSHAMFVIS